MLIVLLPTDHDDQQRDMVLDTALTDAANLNDKGFIFTVYDEFFRAGTIRRLFEVPSQSVYGYCIRFLESTLLIDKYSNLATVPIS